MSPRKFEFTGYTAEVDGVTLHQIMALIDLPGSEIAAGDVGGFVESADNLDHHGQCWVYGIEGSFADSASIIGQARVTGDSRVHDRAQVSGRATVGGFTLLHDTCAITDDAHVTLQSSLTGGAVIFGSAQIDTGEDGPYILPGVAIDFDVRYGTSYITLGSADEPWLFAVSSTGRISEAGSWGRYRWSGDLHGMRALAAERAYDTSLAALVRAAESYLG